MLAVVLEDEHTRMLLKQGHIVTHRVTVICHL